MMAPRWINQHICRGEKRSDEKEAVDWCIFIVGALVSVNMNVLSSFLQRSSFRFLKHFRDLCFWGIFFSERAAACAFPGWTFYRATFPNQTSQLLSCIVLHLILQFDLFLVFLDRFNPHEYREFRIFSALILCCAHAKAYTKKFPKILTMSNGGRERTRNNLNSY